ncbi:alpha/beta fold hydrolase [Phyllobacterium sp. 21LDTY02-6]|uniref:alpha/beta hydrolase n=1 Tax=unclassified Phyllobacterium TaxID=2638441 RepID=UPI0020224241|nr:MULTISPECIES: alpha/beta fold hydrolase [unclassified Phyllobacterium]MCO4315842.1 alpha/beta fold hydrolase [Phyllobacterium sp. 21LDTY02-6]MCX8282299.1 alpha/beta fold hydrolase [Phyllobacterium sp. 0TCS1.6C]MCX8292075.1 alpha/beta fold hydrolase [Phyllobacterium sp. 0TCS1.6A]
MALSRLSVILLIPFLLAGCGGKAVLGLKETGIVKASAAVPAPRLSETKGPKAVVPIFVATSRERSDNLSLPFSARRSAELNFARVDIGIPPSHKSGQVEKSTTKPNPARNFAATIFQPYDREQLFLDKLNAELARRPANQRELLVFVHGYNNNFADSVFRAAQIAHDYAIPGVTLHYAWPSAGSIGLYVYDRDSATFGRDGLAETLRVAARSNASKILLLGHSMGSFVVMEALKELAESGDRAVFNRFSGVMLAAPDIDIDVFQQQAEDIGTLPKPFTVLVSRADRALNVSSRIVGGHPRVGDGSSIPALQSLGIVVLDASSLDGGSHGVFASSPTLMKMARSGELSQRVLEGDEQSPGQAVLADGTSVITGAASLVIYLPARLLDVVR